MSKYCLVRFVEDNILYVVPVKKIKPINEKFVWAPYKKMGCYEAIPIEFHDDRNVLEQRIKFLKQSKGTLVRE